jgi:CHAT domain-containing protein/Flp pilus assembly protein TadD
LNKDHPDAATTLNDLAGLYALEGKIVEAEPLFKHVVEIYEKSLGKDHTDTATSLNNLAGIYRDLGKYGDAETLYKQAIEIRERVSGKDHPDTVRCLGNLAGLYDLQGKYLTAEPLFKRAIATLEERLGKDHPLTATYINNLAAHYRDQGKYEDAEPLYRRALAFWEKLGKDHPLTATAVNNLAELYRAQGRYEDAEPLFKRSLEICEKRLGEDHPHTASSFYNLAGLYALQGKYDVAEPLHKHALDIREKKLGKDHPAAVASLNSLAVLYMTKGDLVQAVKFQSRANAASERNLARNLVIGSERQKLAYLATLSKQTDQTISLHLRYAPDDPLTGALAATLILQRKGRALDATSQNLNALRSRFNAEDQALLDRLTETRSQIATLIFRGPQEMAGEQYQARIKELDDQADKDEAEVSRRSDEFRAQSLPVTLEAVLAAIPDNSALIEFATYRPFNARAAKVDEAYGRPHYVAYVLRHNGEIRWRELGDAETIDRAITALRKAMGNPNRYDVKRLSRAVDEIVFRPIRSQVGESRQLLVSPDGPLNLIPFAALVDEKGRYLVERYAISYLTSGRDLLRLQVARESQSGPMVIANPDFGTPGGGKEESPGRQPAVAEAAEEQSSRSAFDQINFSPLRYTAEEGEALRALLPDATVLTGRQATKAALMQVRSPRLLHIATHGFFLKDLDLTPTGARGGQALSDDPSRTLQELEKNHIRIESPLLRSGLALAGANEHQEKDNGILTALEVTGLNLWGTKLVALSACGTGVGEVKNGDGVHGLRRALVLAGSETQVMSLWSVQDRTARDLMVAYYRRLKDGEGRGEALRQAQLEMLRSVKRRHPYYWASFIQSGEWADLDGHR